MKSSLECVISTSLLILASGITGKITNPPQNAVVEVGGQAIFNCTSDLSGQNWIFSMTREDAENPSAQIVIVFGCLVQPGFSTHYEVQRPGGSNNICNLIVKTTTLQQAGVYSCSDAVIGQSAILIVIDRDAQIAVNRLPETVEGDTVSMSYTVSYNTSTASSKTPTIQPVLSWINFAGTTVGLTASNYTETAYSVTSSISVTAGREDIRPYTCSISYQIKWPSPPTGLSFASNTPSAVPNPPNTSTINVLYAPIISSIEMSEETPVCPGNKAVKLTCFATANPPPDYSWIGPDSISYTGKTIEVEMNGVYICNATNVIRGSTRSIAKETTLNVVCWFWFLLLLWFLNPISTAIFLVHYKCSRGRSDYNERYPFLTRMLPCMNTSEETPCSKVGWTILFIVMAIFSGIQFLILAIVTCVGCRNGGNGRVFGDGCAPTEGTTQSKYARKTIDETAKQKSAQQTKQIENGKVIEAKRRKRKAGTSTHHDQTVNDRSEPQNHATNATGTRFQKVCFALSLAYMILGIILFAISVGVISYECDRQCNKR